MRIFFWGGIALSLLSSCSWYKNKYEPNTKACQKAIFIPSQSERAVAIDSIIRSGCLKDSSGFLEYMVKGEPIKPGRYLLGKGLSNEEIARTFYLGKQSPWNLTFHRIEDMNDLAGIVCRKLEPDSTAFAHAFKDAALLEKHDFPTDPHILPAYFIPNTYEFFWNSSPEDFLERMQKEYQRFWNEDRKSKAKTLGLSPVEVSTLASIVQKEQAKWEDEWPTIAGLYLNRLNIGMRLQADPTVKYALGQPDLRRVLTRHLSIDHPYNTYQNLGLPPGPICIPLPNAIDAVLNYEAHDYLYMCAKADMSGKHAFAKNLAEHNRNARAFQRELNRRGIY